MKEKVSVPVIVAIVVVLVAVLAFVGWRSFSDQSVKVDVKQTAARKNKKDGD